uniref:Uncharacterized protein n=1 Tax=Strombidium inclinatum TaxID=197538 RepID=A0A7S3IM02_9SPIT
MEVKSLVEEVDHCHSLHESSLGQIEPFLLWLIGNFYLHAILLLHLILDRVSNVVIVVLVDERYLRQACEGQDDVERVPDVEGAHYLKHFNAHFDQQPQQANG